MFDLLDAEEAGHIGRALAGEARLVRRTLHSAQDAIAAARLIVLGLELQFARAQFDPVSSTAPTHKTSRLAGRLWQLQRRIDDLQEQIAKLRGKPGLAGKLVPLIDASRPAPIQHRPEIDSADHFIVLVGATVFEEPTEEVAQQVQLHRCLAR